MAKIIQEGLLFCPDCLQAAVNDDYTGLDYHLTPDEAEKRMKAIKKGRASLPGYPVYNGIDEDFSIEPCSCCGLKLAGERYGFNLLK